MLESKDCQCDESFASENINIAIFAWYVYWLSVGGRYARSLVYFDKLAIFCATETSINLKLEEQ